MSVGSELLAVPFPEMVERLAMAIAQAQYSLDSMSFRLAQMMSGSSYEHEWVDDDGKTQREIVQGKTVSFPTVEDGEIVHRDMSMLELGFTPTFYQFVETIIEVKISITVTKSEEHKRSTMDFKSKAKAGVGWFSASVSVTASSVSTSHSSKYQYSTEGASLIRTKLVPVPPPAILEERIQRLIEVPLEDRQPTR